MIVSLTKSLCLVLLSPAEASLMLWLYGNGSIKRAALLGYCRHTSQKIANVAGLWEDWEVYVPNWSQLGLKVTKY